MSRPAVAAACLGLTAVLGIPILLVNLPFAPGISCGTNGMPCCSGFRLLQPETYNRGCPNTGSVCSALTDPPGTVASPTCVACGAVGQPCCLDENSNLLDSHCSAGNACTIGTRPADLPYTCQPCGGSGQPCCIVNSIPVCSLPHICNVVGLVCSA